jgi:hypothetical protein
MDEIEYYIKWYKLEGKEQLILDYFKIKYLQQLSDFSTIEIMFGFKDLEPYGTIASRKRKMENLEDKIKNN